MLQLGGIVSLLTTKSVHWIIFCEHSACTALVHEHCENSKAMHYTDLSLSYLFWHFVWSFADSPILRWWPGIRTVPGGLLLLSGCLHKWPTLCWLVTETRSECCHQRALSRLLSRWCKWEGGLWRCRWEWTLAHPLMSAQRWVRQSLVTLEGQLKEVIVNIVMCAHAGNELWVAEFQHIYT